MVEYSKGQLMALALLPKLTGSCSLCCSCYIIYRILNDKSRWQSPYHRLVLGVSFVDALSSFSFGLSTWPVEASSGVIWAVGNRATCQAQAFFNQVAIGSPLYNGSLAIFYLLTVKYNWKDHQIERIEWLLHLCPLLWAFGTAIAALCLGIYGNAILWCGSGSDYDIYRWIFFYGPLWLMICLVTTCCVLIWHSVRTIEQRALQWSTNGASMEESSGESKRQQTARELKFKLHTKTQQVATQSFLYAGAFFVNWIAVTLTRIFQMAKGTTYFPLLLISASTVPIYGLPNILVYLFFPWLRNRIRQKNRQSQLSLMDGSRRNIQNKNDEAGVKAEQASEEDVEKAQNGESLTV